MQINLFRRLQDDWALLNYYQRFESLIALVLSLVITRSAQVTCSASQGPRWLWA